MSLKGPNGGFIRMLPDASRNLIISRDGNIIFKQLGGGEAGFVIKHPKKGRSTMICATLRR